MPAIQSQTSPKAMHIPKKEIVLPFVALAKPLYVAASRKAEFSQGHIPGVVSLPKAEAHANQKKPMQSLLKRKPDFRVLYIPGAHAASTRAR
jgi:3-mercaptopyruvate sulfurtransferase SseA